tara:strand:+ start:132 stop:590 length:459 start_codon:yes stop_codon:yes gene_type:complete
MSLTSDQEQLLETSKRVALCIGDAGKEFTGLIGELSVCQRFDYTWTPNVGFDATFYDKEDGREKTIQIKTRKNWTERLDRVNPSGTIGKFGRKKGYCFDLGILVELDDNFEIRDVWRRTKEEIKELEANRKPLGYPLQFRTFAKCEARVTEL